MCSKHECERPVKARELCAPHYKAMLRGQRVAGMAGPKRLCSIEGCDGMHEARGWCKRHYRAWVAHGDPEGGWQWERGNRASYLYAKCDRPSTSECWPWTGGVDADGYGRAWIGKATYTKGSRLSWEVHFGDIPEGMLVRHRCDNPPCVNPHHLELGTNADNMRDAAERGRLGGQYEKIPDEVKLEIELRLGAGESKASLARLFNVSRASVRRIARSMEGGDPIAVNPSG